MDFGIADKFVYFTGTLQRPRAAFDSKELLLYGGAAWASGGLSLVYDQIVQRLSGIGNPCDQVMRRMDRQRTQHGFKRTLRRRGLLTPACHLIVLIICGNSIFYGADPGSVSYVYETDDQRPWNDGSDTSRARDRVACGRW